MVVGYFVPLIVCVLLYWCILPPSLSVVCLGWECPCSKFKAQQSTAYGTAGLPLLWRLFVDHENLPCLVTFFFISWLPTIWLGWSGSLSKSLPCGHAEALMERHDTIGIPCLTSNQHFFVNLFVGHKGNLQPGSCVYLSLWHAIFRSTAGSTVWELGARDR